ncbi:MAG: hypothetical protein ACRD29_16135 [Acidimicrobiales bacterium]
MSLGAVEADRSVHKARGPISYGGPHGPLEGERQQHVTVLRGGRFGEVVIEWGSDSDPRRGGLGEGIAARVGTAPAVVRQPKRGLRRAARVVYVQAEGRTWRWREVGMFPVARRRFEREDGTVIAQQPHKALRPRLGVETAADPLEVTLAVLTWAAKLDLRAEGLKLAEFLNPIGA